MAYSWSEQVVPAGTTSIPVDIEYLDKSYIYLYINSTLVERSDYTWSSDQVILLNTAVSTNSTVLIVRRTDKEALYIAFAEGAAFIRENIDTQNTQFLHLAQELVEGRSIEGFYGDLSMNGYRITNLGAGVASTDAVNKGQLDAVDDRVTSIEQSFITATVSYPWYTIAETSTDTFTPGYAFTKAAVYVGGICQIPGYSYVVVDNTILLAEPVPAGTLIFARLGEDVSDEDGYATTAQLANFVEQFQSGLDSKAAKGANLDITSLSGLTTPLSVAQGGTGNATGKAPSAVTADTATHATSADTATSATTATSAGTASTATSAGKLTTARTLQTKLDSTTAISFDGTANVQPGVTGVLGLANGGTGQTTAAAALSALGGQPSTGVVDASSAAAGKLGEVLTATSAADVNLTNNVAASLISLTLTPGDWDVQGVFYTSPTGATISTIAGAISTTNSAVDAFPYKVQKTVSIVVTEHVQAPYRRFNVSANTTIYLTVSANFMGGTVVGRGYLSARRVR